MEDKTECGRYIARVLNSTADWRSKMALKFEDDRNLRAVVTLGKLAAAAPGMSDANWAALQPHFVFGSPVWRDALFEAARMVGFIHKQKSFNSFVKIALRKLKPH